MEMNMQMSMYVCMLCMCVRVCVCVCVCVPHALLGNVFKAILAIMHQAMSLYSLI